MGRGQVWDVLGEDQSCHSSQWGLGVLNPTAQDRERWDGGEQGLGDVDLGSQSCGLGILG